MTRKLLTIVVIVAAVAGIGAVVFWPRGGTPVGHDEAVEQFREQAGSDPADTSTAVDPSAPTLPEPGAYRYRSSGQETVKLAVLPEETRVLGDEVTVTVAAPSRVEATGTTPAGSCSESTLHLFTQHRDVNVVCANAESVWLQSHTKHQQIGALSPVASLTCSDGILIDRSTASGSSPLACSMTVQGGPVEVTTQLTGTSTWSAPVDLDVDGRAVRAVPVEIRFDAVGSVSGPWVERWWLAEHDLLLVKMERELSLAGPATFSENLSLELLSVTPST